MKIDDETRQHVENLLEGRFDEGRKKYRGKLEAIKKDFWMPTTDKQTALNDAHYERADNMRQIFMDTMLGVYRDHDELPGENSIAELSSRLSYQLNKEIQAGMMHLPLNLVTDTHSMINDMCSRLNRDFHNLVREEELRKKREQERHMDEKVVAEKEAKRYAVLKRIYEDSGANPLNLVFEKTIAEKVGLSGEELAEALRYLSNEHLIKYATFGTVSIEHLGLKEIEDSVNRPSESTAHFASYTIQNFYGTVHNIQGGHHNVQNVVINVNPDFDKNISSLVELIRTSSLGEVQKEETLVDLERVSELAQREKTPDVIEAATKRLNLIKTALECVKLGAAAGPYLQYLYHWFNP